jgi:hypothetical protein
MHIISFTCQPIMKLNIHNQCSDFKLTNRKCFSNFMSWNKYPDAEVDTGSTMIAVLTSSWAEFSGAIMYKLQRKRVKSGSQPESTSTLLFVAWKYEGYKKLHLFVRLMECDRTFHWEKFKLEEYYQRYTHQPNTYTSSIKNTWLTRDGTVLMARLKLDSTQSNGVLNIVISEGAKDKHTKRPIWINPERQVLL